MNKEKLIDTLKDMPQDFDLEILMEILIFIEKVEKGLEQLHSGNTITHEEVKHRVKQWWNNMDAICFRRFAIYL